MTRSITPGNSIRRPQASWLATANYIGYWVGAIACAFQPWVWARFVGKGLAMTSAIRLGLVATVAEGQRGVLQYVAPMAFAARLRAPLVAAAVEGRVQPHGQDFVGEAEGDDAAAEREHLVPLRRVHGPE